jgi:hypothetical protein
MAKKQPKTAILAQKQPKKNLSGQNFFPNFSNLLITPISMSHIFYRTRRKCIFGPLCCCPPKSNVTTELNGTVQKWLTSGTCRFLEQDKLYDIGKESVYRAYTGGSARVSRRAPLGEDSLCSRSMPGTQLWTRCGSASEAYCLSSNALTYVGYLCKYFASKICKNFGIGWFAFRNRFLTLFLQ